MRDTTKFPFIEDATGHEIGERTERRFIEATAICANGEPDWFSGIEEASPLLDVRGVDFVAWVKYRGVREPVPVPLQIKSSNAGRERYYEKHPKAKEAGVIVLVIRKETSPAGIRNHLFEELAWARKAGLRYEHYLGRLVRKPARGKGILLQKEIEGRRALRSNTVAAPESSPARSLVFLAPPMSRLERWRHVAGRFLRKKLSLS